MGGRLLVAAVAGLVLAVAPQALAKAPTAVTGPAMSVRGTSATVTGSVDPGGEATSWYVEYGRTTSYGSRTATRSAGNGTVVVDVSEQLTGLSAGGAYHYRVVATNATGTSRGGDRAFTLGAAPSVVTSPAGQLGPTSATVGGTVDPNGLPTGWWVEYGTSTSYGSRTDTQSAGSGTSATGVSTRLAGLNAGVTYHFRVVASNDAGTTRGSDRSFRTDRGPTVSTGGVESVTISSAQLTASVNPQGRGTVAYFEYGTTSALGARTPDIDAGFGTSGKKIVASLTGLQPGTRYYYRVVARSDAGSANGQTRAFATSEGPLVTTGPAQVSGTTAVLTGTVDPFGHSTNWWFELGKTPSYGTSTVVQNAGSGRGGVAVSVSVAGLAAGTEYHARLVARSSAGTTRGGDVVFRTAGLPVVGRPTASAISLTRARIGTEVATSGLETRVWVEVSRRGAVVSRSVAVVLPPSGTSSRLSIPVAGLSPGLRYAFRVLASNAVGTASGQTASFGTAARPRDERGRLVHCTIVGTNGRDRLVGTPRRDVICGLGGGDVLLGREGDDVLLGGPGADYIAPGPGRDRVVAGPGNDFVGARDGRADKVFGGSGADRARVDRRLDVTQSVTRV